MSGGPLPILYSFRRCPYAIRARLALRVAGVTAEVREVSLKAKPPELLEASAKGTVPVLVVPDGPAHAAPRDRTGSQRLVIDESLAIMRWALERHDPQGLLCPDGQEELIATNDGPFKHHLDRFKYASRYAGEDAASHRAAALAILRPWNARLEGWDWLLGARPCLADWAVLPFVRQFRLADPQGFDTEPALAPLRRWLERFLRSEALAAVMDHPWAHRLSWRSPHWLYHLALEEDWHQARREGRYRRSTRGLGLEEVGFIHASHAHQVDATFRRFYADAGRVVVLSIDPWQLSGAGIPVEEEVAPGSDERFPHIRGALPLEAVVAAEVYRPDTTVNTTSGAARPAAAGA
jgi:glutathione S-transferase